MQTTETKLTNVQLELLKLFQYDLSEQDLYELKTILAKFFAKKLDQAMDKFVKENNITEETINQWLNEHARTEYK